MTVKSLCEKYGLKFQTVYKKITHHIDIARLSTPKCFDRVSYSNLEFLRVVHSNL